eukprot:gene14061-20002_t
MNEIADDECQKEVFYFEKMEVNNYNNDVILAAACRTDVDKFCAEVEAGEGRVHECLRQNRKGLSEGCRREELLLEEQIMQAGAKDAFCNRCGSGHVQAFDHREAAEKASKLGIGYDDEMAHNPKQARRLRNQLDSMEAKRRGAGLVHPSVGYDDEMGANPKASQALQDQAGHMREM